jgi:two-component system KDP operon response regulator KdpE
MGKTTGRRILIVEDDLATLYTLRAMFDRAGWDVSSARTLAGALVSLVPAPEWIVLDLGLADGDGEEVLRSVRESGIGTRVAVFSGALDHERIARLAPWRPDLVIAKPIAFTKLLEAVSASVREEPAFGFAGLPQSWDSIAWVPPVDSVLAYQP